MQERVGRERPWSGADWASGTPQEIPIYHQIPKLFSQTFCSETIVYIHPQTQKLIPIFYLNKSPSTFLIFFGLKPRIQLCLRCKIYAPNFDWWLMITAVPIKFSPANNAR